MSVDFNNMGVTDFAFPVGNGGSEWFRNFYVIDFAFPVAVNTESGIGGEKIVVPSRYEGIRGTVVPTAALKVVVASRLTESRIVASPLASTNVAIPVVPPKRVAPASTKVAET